MTQPSFETVRSDRGLEEGSPSLSVVIPSYNMAASIGRCLAAVVAQQTSASVEVIVVDSSVDGTPSLVRRSFPGVTLIHLPQRESAAVARNIGIRRARAPIVAFLDADCIPDPGWAEAILRTHASPHELVAGAVLPASPHSLTGLMLFAIEFSGSLPQKGVRLVSFAPSCNLSAKTDALAAIGLFPEEFYRGHDVVFCYRYMQIGRGPILFEPAIRVRHVCRTGLRVALRHLALLGRYSAMVRRAYPIEGHFLVDRPSLVLLAIPLRYFRIVGRLFRSSSDRWMAPLLVALSPLLLVGLASWALGFSRGARASRDPARPP